MTPRVFLDTGNVDEIRDALETAIIHGIATNPDKIARTGKSLRQAVEEITEVFDGPIAVQALGNTADELEANALELNKLGPSMAVKIPANYEGIKAIARLVPQGVKTNATLMFSASQALAAGLAGSPFISPFIGRSYDVGYDGIQVIAEIREIYDAYDIDTCVIAASIKDTKQVVDSIIAGADSIAVTYEVLRKMTKHALTEEGLAGFVERFSKIPKDKPRRQEARC
jgi:transaldolase